MSAKVHHDELLLAADDADISSVCLLAITKYRHCLAALQELSLQNRPDVNQFARASARF